MTEPTHQPGGVSPLVIRARSLVDSARRGILCTLLRGDHTPYGSLVDVLPVDDGDVVMFLSALAEHRRNLEAEPRASVLIAPSIMEPDALALPRVTLVGKAEQVEDRNVFADPYVALHPDAQMYIGFPDFAFFRLHVEKARYIAGFGEMGWLDREQYRSAKGDGTGD